MSEEAQGIRGAFRGRVLLIGDGEQAVVQAEILDDLGTAFDVVGFEDRAASRVPTSKGGRHMLGLEKYVKGGDRPLPTHAIIAVPQPQQHWVSYDLLMYGVPNVLFQAPGALNYGQVELLRNMAAEKGANARAGHPMRFSGAAQAMREMLAEDGGARECSFDFSALPQLHVLSQKSEAENASHFLLEASHIADLAFHLGGKPESLECEISGATDWHPSGAVFKGSGKTTAGAPLHFHADWTTPSASTVRVTSGKRRFTLELGKGLRVEDMGESAAKTLPPHDNVDQRFAPGLWRQTIAFLNGDHTVLPDIHEHWAHCQWYHRMQYGEEIR